jgi:hypothetical protein
MMPGNGGEHAMASISLIEHCPEPGAFDPEAVAAIGRALEGAVGALGVGDNEMKREAVAQFIIHLAQWGRRPR